MKSLNARTTPMYVRTWQRAPPGGALRVTRERSDRRQHRRCGRPGHADQPAGLARRDLHVVDESADDREAHLVLLGLHLVGGVPRGLDPGDGVRRLVADLDGELLLLLDQRHLDRRRDADVLMQT